jgi:hypothetical protein
MADKSPTIGKEQDDARLLLARVPLIRGACELDLLGFLRRHPRSLLTSEQLAVFVGYDMKQVAKSIEAFTEAGLLGRTKNRLHSARMYSLELNGQQGEGLARLLELAGTKQGRRDLLEVLAPRQSQQSPVDAVH